MIGFNYPRHESFWRNLARTSEIISESGETYQLNKMQRYQAIKELAKWNYQYEDLFEAEYRRDYSDADDLAKHRI